LHTKSEAAIPWNRMDASLFALRGCTSDEIAIWSPDRDLVSTAHAPTPPSKLLNHGIDLDVPKPREEC
jgi:hypothetical protein